MNEVPRVFLTNNMEVLKLFQDRLFRFVTSHPKQNFTTLVLINHFLHETAFRHKPYGGKESIVFRPFFLPQQSVVSKCQAQSW